MAGRSEREYRGKIERQEGEEERGAGAKERQRAKKGKGEEGRQAD